MFELEQGFCCDPIAKRTRLSFVLLLALCFWAVAAFTFQNASGLSIDGAFFCGAVGVVLALTFVLLAKRTASQKAFALFLVLALSCTGITCGMSGVSCMEHSRLQLGLSNENSSAQRTLSLFVLSDSQESSYGTSLECLARVSSGTWAKLRVYTKDDTQWYYGQSLTANMDISLPSERQKDFYWSKGFCAKAQIETIKQSSWLTPFANERAQFIQTVRSTQGDTPQTVLLLALACGYRILLNDSGLYRDFQVAGLAHIVAVSGAHLSIAVAVVTALLLRMRVRKVIQIAVGILSIILFLFVCAFPISAFRAAFMSCMACLSFFAKRRSASQNALGLCIFVCLLTDPSLSVSVSFALSALSTLGIIVFVPSFMHFMGKSKKQKPLSKITTLIKESIALTLAASIATLPLSAALFAQVSLIAPISNVVLGFMFTPICISALACQLFFLATGVLPVGTTLCAQSLCAVFSFLVNTLASIPYAAIPMELSIEVAVCISASLFFLIFAYQRKVFAKGLPSQFLRFAQRKHRIFPWACVMVAGALIVTFIVGGKSSISLSALDVGQGDALLLCDGPANILVDTGNQDTLLKRELAKKGVCHLDAVFITHPDNDHCGSLPVLLSVVQVETGYVPADLLECSCSKCIWVKQTFSQAQVPLQGLEVGDSLQTKHCYLTTLWPYAYTEEGGNQDSLCLNIEVDVNTNAIPDFSAVLVGDAESETLEHLDSLGLIQQADIFKVGHHGSAVSCSQKLLDKISPLIALMSVGEYNRYGHPNAAILSLLEQNNIAIARTDKQGTVTCFFEEKGIRLTTSQ